MYYLLNCVPSVLYIGLYIVTSILNKKVNFGVLAIIYLFVQPLYLLIVNIPFIYKKSKSYAAGIICMFSVIVFNALYTMLMHKIQTGYFLGDVPEGIYYLMVGIPVLIIIAGMGVIFLIRKVNADR